MVRRATSSNLGELAISLHAAGEAAHFKQDLLPLFATLSGDEQDSVRLLAVENCVAVGKLLTVSENQTAVRGPHAHCPQASRRSTSRPATRAQVLPIIRAVAQDKSWRVRYVVATHFCDLVPSVGEDVTKLEMLPTFVRLLQDGEAEVRTAAGFKVTVFSEMVSPELVLEHILPCVRELCADTSQHVRASVASVIMGLAPVVGKAGTIDHLLPLFLQLLLLQPRVSRTPISSRPYQLDQIINFQL